MKDTWCLIANGSTAVLWKWDPTIRGLREIWEMTHPDSRAPRSALRRDRPGRFRAAHARPGEFTGRSDPKRREADLFAREVMERVASEMATSECRRLFIVAPEPLWASWQRFLPAELRERIAGTLAKDYTHLGVKQLQRLLEKAEILPSAASRPRAVLGAQLRG